MRKTFKAALAAVVLTLGFAAFPASPSQATVVASSSSKCYVNGGGYWRSVVYVVDGSGVSQNHSVNVRNVNGTFLYGRSVFINAWGSAAVSISTTAAPVYGAEYAANYFPPWASLNYVGYC